MKKTRLIGALLAGIMAFSGIAAVPEVSSPFIVSASAASKLAAPQDVTVSVSGTTVRLVWSHIHGADAYRVYRYNSKKKKYVKYKDITYPTCEITGLTLGKTYKFKVAALVKNSSGKYKEQTLSKPIEVKVKKLGLPKLPSFGIDGASAVKELKPASYYYNSDDSASAYVCNLKTDSGSLVLICTGDDTFYGACYYVLGDNVSPDNMIAQLRKKYGKGKTYKDGTSVIALWDRDDRFDFVQYGEISKTYGYVMYCAIDKKLAPEKMIKTFNDWVEEQKNGGDKKSSANPVQGIAEQIM